MFLRSPYFLLIAGLSLLALFLFLISRLFARKAGIPEGRIIASDHGEWRKTIKPLYDASLGLTGKPDYLIKKDGKLIPAEVKSSYAPRSPYDSHIMQLAAYCILVDRAYGEHPPYGLLRYRNRTFEIPFTPELESKLLAMIETIRRCKNRGEVPRSHNSPTRCARCGYLNSCDQRL